jgi:hypothetical protein
MTQTAFDQAPDREELLSYLMYDQSGPQRREAALEHARELSESGLCQLRSEMRHRARERQQAGHADNYSPWHRD